MSESNVRSNQMGNTFYPTGKPKPDQVREGPEQQIPMQGAGISQKRSVSGGGGPGNTDMGGGASGQSPTG